MPDRSRLGKAATTSAPPSGLVAASGGPQPAAPGRVLVGAGEPEPPISGRPDGVATSLMESKRITPRSPRAALEPDHMPVPSRRSRRVRNPLVIMGNAVFTALVLVLIVAGGAVVFGKSRLDAPGPLQEDKIVSIPPRSGVMDIADLLNREGVMDVHRLVFVGGVFALKARSELKAGEYLFAKQASVKDVIETIVDGKVVQHQITIPEGLTSEQIVARLLENDVLSGNIKDVPREGSLLPDGYHFNRGFTREQMIQRLRQAQDRLVREVWERRNPDLPLKTPDQLIILASIIEKETSKPEERTRIAAVLTNRLKQKMKLQSDPTIIYGLVFGKGALGRPLTKSDIAQPTPYNTYVIDGLPPGPIANPGRASIEAAANPARTKELYFVADGTGGHAFAETYDQHLKNVARLRAIEHELKGEPPASEVQPPASAPSTRTAPAPAQRSKRSAIGSSRNAGAAQ
jgi:peptidoglycan lytic transglycosylase G